MRSSTSVFCFPALFLAVLVLATSPLACHAQPGGAAADKAAEAADPATGDSAAKKDAESTDTYAYILMKTSRGNIVLRLNESLAPMSTANFLKYAKEGAYDGTIFHRVIDGFMIQGGGFGTDYEKRPTSPPIKNEGLNGLKNDRYTIAMARTQAPDSATNQFYINVNDNNQLNTVPGRPGYAVFGHVIAGRKVVDEIRQTPKQDRGSPFTDSPEEPIVIEKVQKIDLSEAEKMVVADGGKASDCTEPTENEKRAKNTTPLDATDVAPKDLPGIAVDRPADGENNGMKWWVIEEGTGEKPGRMEDQVTVHYEGYLLNGSKFDSSVDRGQPATFPLNRVIPGWQLGVSQMKVGETKKLMVPADPWGYGARGTPGGPIPPNATLVFDVKLISIQPAGPAVPVEKKE
ncbi:MAG: peptidylprolyl isomerase [Phycisphaerales bacterium]|nr:peptidylprolyl isomerase [Phycisphaerales bacterium]